jgi:hypothetical protein
MKWRRRFRLRTDFFMASSDRYLGFWLAWYIASRRSCEVPS